MIRYTLPPLLLLAVVGSVSAQPAPLDLKGKTLEATFTELLPGMGSADNGARSNAQQRWQDICFALGAPGNEKQRIEACKLMAAKLDAKTPNAARLWLLQQLQRLGHEESVDAVAAVLDDKDDEVREMAVRALANNPSPSASEKLVTALGAAKGKAKVGILNGLGHRGDAKAVEAIAKELTQDDEIAIAAVRALGRIAGDVALHALLEAEAKAKGRARIAIFDSLLIHADRLLKGGKTDEAAKIYQHVSQTIPLFPDSERRGIELAALRGMIQTSGDKAGELVLELLASENPKTRAIALGQIDSLNSVSLKTLAGSMDKLPVPTKVLVINAIAARGDRSQLPVALSAAKSTEAEVKRAGVIALGRLGDASTVEFLLDLMSGKDAVAGIAGESLAAIPTDGVNEKIIEVLGAEKAAGRRVALIVVLERRRAVSSVPALMKAAGDMDGGVRTAAFSGLKILASPADVPAMIAALPKTAKGNERDQAEIAIVTVSAKLTNPEKQAEPVLAAIKGAPKDHVAILLPLLGRLGGADALKVVRESLSSTDALIHDAAVAGICNWPNAAANEDLLALSEKGRQDSEKIRAIQALIRVNAALVERTPEEKLAALATMKKAMELATREQERHAILENVGFIRHIETLHFLLPYLDQPAFAQSACKGIVELAHSKMVREPKKAEFDKVLDRVIAMCKDNGLVDRAKKYKEGQ